MTASESEYLALPDPHLDPVVAASYDRDPSHARFSREAIGATVEVLSELAGDGVAVEFAVGTGRIALPLASYRRERPSCPSTYLRATSASTSTWTW